MSMKFWLRDDAQLSNTSATAAKLKLHMNVGVLNKTPQILRLPPCKPALQGTLQEARIGSQRRLRSLRHVRPLARRLHMHTLDVIRMRTKLQVTHNQQICIHTMSANAVDNQINGTYVRCKNNESVYAWCIWTLHRRAADNLNLGKSKFRDRQILTIR